MPISSSRTNDDGGEYGVNYYTATAIQVIDYKTVLDSTPYMNAVYDLALPWQDATPAQRR